MKLLLSLSAAAVVATLAPLSTATAADLARPTYRPFYRQAGPAPVIVRGPGYDAPRYRVIYIDHSHDQQCEDSYDLADECRYQGSF